MAIGFNRLAYRQLLVVVESGVIADSLSVAPVVYIINSKVINRSDIFHKYLNLGNFLFVVYK